MLSLLIAATIAAGLAARGYRILNGLFLAQLENDRGP
jgi:hypothetical protein